MKKHIKIVLGLILMLLIVGTYVYFPNSKDLADEFWPEAPSLTNE
ncbi:hypothetical protein [Bacillus sp. V3-13]|nr:hypothetical protein [Bacillus sp. V3-13]